MYFIHDETTDHNPSHDPHPRPLIHRLTSSALYEIMHARLGHPGGRVMQDIHLHASGVPKLRKPTLFKCGSCTLVNATKRAISQKEVKQAIASNQNSTDHPKPDSTQNTSPSEQTPEEQLLPGQTFQADMGFVRGTKYHHKDEDGQIITSMDGFNSYLIVVDRATRFTWIFLSRNKAPPITLLKGFLQTHGTKQPVRKRIRTDKRWGIVGVP
jgi:hypothetical protein